jgi:hypothetical protein
MVRLSTATGEDEVRPVLYRWKDASEVREGDRLKRAGAGDAIVLSVERSPFQTVLHLVEEDGEETSTSLRSNERLQVRRQ